jgi:hypothetical protein
MAARMFHFGAGRNRMHRDAFSRSSSRYLLSPNSHTSSVLNTCSLLSIRIGGAITRRPPKIGRLMTYCARNLSVGPYFSLVVRSCREGFQDCQQLNILVILNSVLDFLLE